MEPSRERDAAVHRALWPDELIQLRWIDYGPLCFMRDGKWHIVPEYSTDLSAWPSIDGEWAIWNRDDRPGVVFAEVEWEKWDDPQRRLEMLTYAEAEIGDGTWQAAAAFALALCVLQRKVTDDT